MSTETEREGGPMSVMNERIETAFLDEYSRLKHEGLERILEQRLDALLYQVYRRGYIRGHSDRSREVQLEQEQAIREGRLPMGVTIRYEGDKLVLGGRDLTPKRPPEEAERARRARPLSEYTDDD